MRLIPGCFDDTNRAAKDRLFGLYEGQERNDPLVRGVLWYSGLGLLIGDGDLDVHDVRELVGQLQADEFFLTIHASHAKNTIRQSFPLASEAELRRQLRSAGSEFISRHAAFCFTQGQALFLANETQVIAGNADFVVMRSLELAVTRRGAMLERLRAVPSALQE